MRDPPNHWCNCVCNRALQTKLAFHVFLEEAKAFYLTLAVKLQQRWGDAGLPSGEAAFFVVFRRLLPCGPEAAGPWHSSCGPLLNNPSLPQPPPPTHPPMLQPWRRSSCRQWGASCPLLCRPRHAAWTVQPRCTAAWCAWVTCAGEGSIL